MAKTATKKVEVSAPANTGLAAIAAQISNAVEASVSAGTVARRAAVEYTNGTVSTADGRTVKLAGALADWNGKLPATNPANKGSVGTVKQAGRMVTVGNGRAPRSQHGAAMFAAVCSALPCTAERAAEVAGSGGAQFISYALKNGWLKLD